MHLGDCTARKILEERYLFAAQRDTEVDMMSLYIVRQSLSVCTHAAHMAYPFRAEGFMIILVEIEGKCYYLHLLVQRETGIVHAFGRTFGGEDGDLMIRMGSEPIHLLRQHPLHTSGVIQMRNTIEDFHTVSSFLFGRCEIPMTMAKISRLQVTRRGSKRSGARG